MVPRIVLRSSFLLVLTVTVFTFPSGVWSETIIECPDSIAPGIGASYQDLSGGWEPYGNNANWATDVRALFDSRILEIVGSHRQLVCKYVFDFDFCGETKPHPVNIFIKRYEPAGTSCEEYETPLPKPYTAILKNFQNKFKCEVINKLESQGPVVVPRFPVSPTK